MAHIDATQTIDSVVQEAIHQGRKDDGEYLRYLQFAIRGYRYLRAKVINEGVQIVKKTPSSINRISFPEDMEEFVGLGVPVNGKIWWLTRNDAIIPTTTTVEDEETLDDSVGEGVDLTTAQPNSYQSTGGINLEGYYTVDWENRKIIVNANRLTELLLAYVSSGIEATDETYIPSRCVDAMIAYIMYQDAIFDRGVALSERGLYKALWEERYRDLKDPFTLQEFKDTIRSTYTLLPR